MKHIKLTDLIKEDSNANGDCYDTAGRYILGFNGENIDNKHRLVHGMVNGQGQLTGLRFGHAWIEHGNMVIDKSNGNDVTLPKEIYYKAGHIKEDDNKYYTQDEAREWILETGNWGPWEMDSDPVRITEDIPDDQSEIGKRGVKLTSRELKLLQ